MQSYNRTTTITDDTSLRLLTEGYLDLNGTFSKIQDTYESYLKTKGCPYQKAISLTKPQIDCLHLAYESGAKKFKLDWIHGLREYVTGSCPMCGSSSVGTVEHYLPKSPFPEFSIFSFNLLPSCGPCNSKRGSKHNNTAKHKLLHPIFDKDILDKLQLITIFDLSNTILDFELSYNTIDYTSSEQLRISAHISTCVDRRAYRITTLNHKNLDSIRSKNKTQPEFEQWLKEELDVLKTANTAHGWHAAYIRGMIAVSHGTRQKIFNSKTT